MATPFGIGSFVAIEVTLLLAVVVRGFGAEARLEREHGDSIRAAESGYDSGQVVPAMAELIAGVDELLPHEAVSPDLLRRLAIVAGRREEDLADALGIQTGREDVLPAIADALSRGSITEQLRQVITASTKRGDPRRLEQRTRRGWTAMAWTMLGAQLAAAAAFINALTNSDTLPDRAVIAARVLLAVFGVAVFATAVFIRHAERAMARAIRAGKDAGAQAG